MHVLAFTPLYVFNLEYCNQCGLVFSGVVFGLPACHIFPEAPKNFYLPTCNCYHRHSGVYFLEISISLTVNGAFKRFGDNFKR